MVRVWLGLTITRSEGPSEGLLRVPVARYVICAVAHAGLALYDALRYRVALVAHFVTRTQEATQ